MMDGSLYAWLLTTVVGPRDVPDYPLNDTVASDAGEASATACGGPIPQLCGKYVMRLTPSGDIKPLNGAVHHGG